MTRMKSAFLAISFVLVVVAAAVAQQKTISASKAWITAPAAGETTALAVAVVENPTMYDAYVVSAATDVAGKVEFERAAKAPDAKPQVVETMTAPAYGSIELTKDGIHLRLSDLKRALKPGENVVFTFTTDNGSSFEVAAEVRAAQ
jgi:periplasmic copper chaperone A